ncbi:MAG: hypothetical protein ACKOWG_01085, partial [Planctomycetia bacterium]
NTGTAMRRLGMRVAGSSLVGDDLWGLPFISTSLFPSTSWNTGSLAAELVASLVRLRGRQP